MLQCNKLSPAAPANSVFHRLSGNVLRNLRKNPLYGGKYGVRLPRYFFLSDKNGYPLKEDYVYVYEYGKR